MLPWREPLGATPRGDGTVEFRVWAQRPDRVAVRVRGPSEVVDPGAWPWTDDGWAGLDLDDLVVYELHVGTFTPEGTFAAAAARLPALRDLGITAVELMPVATFPGNRNWGYDGLYTWAAHPAYGGPAGLAAFVDAAHAAGLGVILDVVYNHLGPGSFRSLSAISSGVTRAAARTRSHSSASTWRAPAS